MTVLRHQAGENVHGESWFASALDATRTRWIGLFYVGLAAAWDFPGRRVS